MSGAIDRNTSLCLACSASLPPSKRSQSDIFVTECCHQPICPSCVSVNPRLTRYNPCLACLGGVDLVASGSTSKQAQLLKSPTSPTTNINGAVRDEDTFVLGDDDDDDDDDAFGRQPFCAASGDGSLPLRSSGGSSPPSSQSGLAVDPNIDPWKDSASLSTVKQSSGGTPATAPSISGAGVKGDSTTDSNPESEDPGLNVGTEAGKYYLRANDTLQGLALRFRVDAKELCRINNLPLSTIRTTPQLLHTRVHIVLPPGIPIPPSARPSQQEVDEREANRVRERAASKLQRLTKEADWRVAKAYVALAEDEEAQMQHLLKQKELGRTPGSAGGVIEEIAVSQYLDDLEWESGRNDRRWISQPKCQQG